MFLKNMEAAARQVDGPSVWTAADGTVFEEIAVGELEAARMKREFDLARAKSIMASASEFATSAKA